MLNQLKLLCLLLLMVFSVSGCGVLSAALAAGASYGIYQATR
jgi:hypothetical protein